MNKVIDKARKHAKRKQHIRKTVSGTAQRPRMTVFRSNQHMYVQVIDDTVGNTLCSVSSLEPEFKELRNTVANALVIGEAIGKRCLEKGIKTVVFDRNGYLYHGIVKGIADGARKAGMEF